MSTVTTIERFILDHQPEYARGELTNLLYDIALAAKIIAHKTNRAGLIDIVGEAGQMNVQGESQQKLDSMLMILSGNYATIPDGSA